MYQCIHCDEQAPLPIFIPTDLEKKQPFCCEGCLTVFEVLSSENLSSYYDIKNKAGIIKRRSPVEISERSYSYLDDERFLKNHSYRTSEEKLVMEFYLEGIHCLACLWLVEKLPELVEGVLSSKLDIEKSVLSVVVTDDAKFSQVAKKLDVLGYKPHALSRDSDSKKFQQKEERTALYRLGVAGAASGNVMIYSVSLYAGASEDIAKVFSILTVLLSVPVFTFSAWPFYTSAWTSLKNKAVSVDIPIAISLIIGFFMGCWGLVNNYKENYFDSLTTLVFLLLLSRYFLKKIQEKGLAASDLFYFYQNESVLRKTDSGFEEVHHDFLKSGDIVKVPRDQFIPGDGIIIEGDSYINSSLLTGESLPERVNIGCIVFSGTQNVGSDLILKIEKTTNDSRIGKILRNVEQGWALRSQMVDFTSVVAKYFTLAVILIAVGLFFVTLQSDDIPHALSRALTLLIVTCPCALAISVPLTFHRSLSMAAQNGIIVKSDEVFEKISKSNKVFLDKTGTITTGRIEVLSFLSERPLYDIVLSLEKYSRHPIARALCEFAIANKAISLQIDNYREIPGRGVEGTINGHFYEIGSGEVKEDGHVVGTFSVRDNIRSDSKEVISQFEKLEFEVAILSGDKKEVVNRLAQEAGIKTIYSEVSPEEKLELVTHEDIIMVGDGANDAMALGGAGVGIAVSGAMDISLRASDVYLTSPGLSGVEKLIILSRETMKLVKRNIVLSILYNTCSVILVFMGLINPLVAAVIMPLSSLTVLTSTLIGTKKMRLLWKS